MDTFCTPVRKLVPGLLLFIWMLEGEKNHTMIILVRIELFVFTEKKKEKTFLYKTSMLPDIWRM